MDEDDKGHSKRVNPPIELDMPERYESLSESEKEVLQHWITENLEPTDRMNKRSSSYGMKHFFEKSENGFYITNGAFKGAMLVAGYRVDDRDEKNWSFNVSQKSINRLIKWMYGDNKNS